MIAICLLFFIFIAIVINIYFLSILKDKKMEYLFQLLKDLDKKWEDINNNEYLNLDEKKYLLDKIYYEYQQIVKQCDNHVKLKNK